MIKNRNLVFYTVTGASDMEDKGLRMPMLDFNASEEASGTAYEGMLAYDTNANKLMIHTGSAWETVTSS